MSTATNGLLKISCKKNSTLFRADIGIEPETSWSAVAHDNRWADETRLIKLVTQKKSHEYVNEQNHVFYKMGDSGKVTRPEWLEEHKVNYERDCNGTNQSQPLWRSTFHYFQLHYCILTTLYVTVRDADHH